MKRKLVEQFNRFSIPHESAADVWCRWLNFGQSAWETTWWHFRLLDCSSEQINIFESTLLSAASVDETSCAFEWQRNPIAIEFSETGTVELIVDVITNNNNHSTIENGVISARFQNIMTIFIQFTDGIFNHLLHIFRLEPELWAIVHLLWRNNVNKIMFHRVRRGYYLWTLWTLYNLLENQISKKLTCVTVPTTSFSPARGIHIFCRSSRTYSLIMNVDSRLTPRPNFSA